MIDRRRCRGFLVMMTLVITISGFGRPLPEATVAAQSPIPIQAEAFPAKTTATIDFPRGITVSGLLDVRQLEPDQTGAIELLYRIGGDETMHLVTTSTQAPSAAGQTRAEATIDLRSSFVPAGVEVEVLWRVPLAGERFAESDTSTVSWFDDRWEWQTVASSQVTVHYVDLDAAFAQTILDSAQATVTDLERRFGLERSAPIAIWTYSTAEAFRGAQQPNSREGIAAASYPGFQLIIAIIPNGDTRELGRVIPHEISHQILHQATGNPFALPPLWFDEGLATHYQVGGTEGFLEMVIRARERGDLFDLGSLEVSFPYASDKATLAYATSWSATAYIHEVFGDDGIAAMIAAFATGAPYPEAIQQALHMTRDELNLEWRAWLSRQAVSAARKRIPSNLESSARVDGLPALTFSSFALGTPAPTSSLPSSA